MPVENAPVENAPNADGNRGSESFCGHRAHPLRLTRAESALRWFGGGVVYVVARLGQALTVLLLAFTGAFVLLQAMPGDAILIKFENPELGLSQDQIAAIRESYGADRPVVARYVESLAGFLTGNFGYSVASGTPVLQLVSSALPSTLVLAGSALAVAVLFAVGLAVASTTTRFAWLSAVLRSLPPLFVSIPVFWLGILLIQVFSFQLGLVSVIRPGPIEGLILPVITLAIPTTAPLAQVLVRSFDEVSTRPFVAVLRARGASHSWILWRSVFRNAVTPALTIAGVLCGELIGGAVVTETVFGRTGIGRVTADAVSLQDTPVILAVVVLSATVFVAVNLIVDLLYPVIDPRLRTNSATRRRVLA